MANRLLQETSPYLLQHAHNPVDWYPWGEEARARAISEDKPILLSVGYSACHWCHVMERESFENDAVAAQMNRDFVCVKLDREERPDLDKVYMQAVQAFTGGHGGWPMTLFLTPDGRPFLGGTYFPPAPRGGMPGFPEIMNRAAALWRDERGEVEEVAGNLKDHISGQGSLPAPGELQSGWLEAVARAADKAYDDVIPGFGAAPRFPRSWTITALLAHWRRSGWARSLEMAEGLLDVMASGGMYDVAGGGFARYSTDREWLIPHFEKMLYDNAQLVPAYLDAYLATGHERHARVARETLDFVLRELRDPAGGFTSALDADSLNPEGVSEEGYYYTWTPAELDAVLGDEGARAAALLSVTAAGNFEHGRSALRPPAPLEDLPADDRAFLERIYPLLVAAREERTRPGLDDKMITAWNGLMIAAMAQGAAVLGDSRYADAAREASDFLLQRVTSEGRLRRNWKLDTAGNERLGAPAFLDDHAFLIHGLLALYEATFDPRWLDEALVLADKTVALFWDDAEGGFFYTGNDAEETLARQKPILGSALPGGNEMAAWAFSRLEGLCGREDLGQRAERVLASLQEVLPRAPLAMGPALLAAAWRTGAVQEVGIAADFDDADGDALLAEVRRRYQPFRVVARVQREPVPSALPWMAGRAEAGTSPTAYVCIDRACLLPARTVAELAEQLDGLDAPSEVMKPAGLGGLRVHAPKLPDDPAVWLNTDTPLTLERLKGNVVVLDFWALCCINCHHILPELAAVEERFAGQPVAVVGVHSAKFTAEKERDRVAQAIARHSIQHPVVVDPDHALWKQYTVKSWPTVMVLDATGRIAFKQSGESDRETLSRVIEALLEEGEDAGVLGEAVWSRPTAAEVTEVTAVGLRFPGKVHVYPSELEQARGADPLDDGRLYVADTGHHRIIEASLSRGPDGWPVANTLRTFGDGTPGLLDGTEARFQGPQGMSRGGEVLWVADTENHALRRIDLTTGAVTTAAGTGRLGRGLEVSGDPTRPRSVDLRSPWDVAVQPEQEIVFIAMAGAHQIWIYLEDRDQLGPYAGSGREDHVDGDLEEAALAQPSGLSLLGNYLFFADSEISSIRVLELHRRDIGTLVGKGLFDFGDEDGHTSTAMLQHPLGVTSTPAAAYVADTYNGKIKRIDLTSRQVTTIAGGFAEPGGLTLAGEYLIVANTNAHDLKVLHIETGEVRPLTLQDRP